MMPGVQKEALVASRIEVERFPGSVRAHNTRVALLALERLDEAAESFRRALQLDPNHRNARQNMAETRRQQGRFVESLRWYGSVLETDPEYAPAHAGIGYAMLRFERQEEALESLARAIALQPESPDAVNRQVSMGRALEALGRTEEAAGHYADAPEIDPRSATALDSFAVLRFRQERYEESLGFYGTLIEIGEVNAQVHANVGVALYNMGRPEEALRSLERALSLDPDLDMARTGRREAARDTGGRKAIARTTACSIDGRRQRFPIRR